MISPEYEKELSEREERQKRWDAVVSAAIRDVESSHLKARIGFHHTTFFGAMGIDPKHLAIWCFFDKDSDLKSADDDGFTKEVCENVRARLKAHGYPAYLTPSFFVAYATDEDVKRTCDGNYWHYLK